jgi:hypothetical protein
MSTSDLLDVFGGQDNLILMCGAKDFCENKERESIRFTVDSCYVWIMSCAAGYGLYLWNPDTLEEFCVTGSDVLQIRRGFETHTGYSLSF